MPPNQKVNPRKKAQEVLKEQTIKGVPVPVERIARKLGAVVRFSPMDDELSGMLYIKDGQPIIGVNSVHHPNRQRFTIAHEIGHLVMHRELLTGTVHVDKNFSVLARDSNSALGIDEIEIQANQFASELLMPDFFMKDALKNKATDIDDDSPIEELARKLRVSKQALENRIRNMD